MKKNSRFIITFLLIFSLIIGGTPLLQAEAASNKKEEKATFELTMLDVGQGLSILIKADGKYMLYDGGDRDTSSYVVSYLKKHSSMDFEYIFASHYHSDHIAGLVGVLNTSKAKKVVCPDYSVNTKIYKSFTEMLKKNGAKVVHPKAGNKYELGEADITVLHADNKAEDENNRSIAIRIDYGKTSVIITGDCEADAELEMVNSKYDLEADVLVAGHHGSTSSNTAKFLEAVEPSYVLISSGEGNSYGHPTSDTLDNIKKAEAEIYRTDTQNEVTLYSDGKSYWFSEEPTDNWKPGEKEVVKNTATQTYTNSNKDTNTKTKVDKSIKGTADEKNCTYVLNTNTKKIHLPGCSSVNTMKDKNKGYTNKTIEQLMKEGYDPCKRCKP